MVSPGIKTGNSREQVGEIRIGVVRWRTLSYE